MMKKVLFALAAVAAFSLTAADFELKFTGNKANWGNIVYYLVKIENKPFAGAKMASVVLPQDPKAAKKDTGFALHTQYFNVKGKKTVKVEGEFYASMNVASPTGQTVRTGIVWKTTADPKVCYDFKKDKITPFKLPVQPGKFAKFSYTLPVVAGIDRAFVAIGFDQPDIVGTNAVAVKSLKVTVE